MTSSDSARSELARAASARGDAIDDLDWIAFLYVADELSSAERRAFETRLADDQLAREAVASAVELTQVVVALRGDRNAGEAISCEAGASLADRTPDLAVDRARGRWAPVAWMSAGAAVCLAAVLCVQAMFPIAQNRSETAGRSNPPIADDSNPTENNPTDSNPTENLAVLWSQLRQESPDADLPEAFGPELRETSPDDFGEVREDETSSVAALRTPSWMVAAVSGPSAKPDARAGEPNDATDDDAEEL